MPLLFYRKFILILNDAPSNLSRYWLNITLISECCVKWFLLSSLQRVVHLKFVSSSGSIKFYKLNSFPMNFHGSRCWAMENTRASCIGLLRTKRNQGFHWCIYVSHLSMFPLLPTMKRWNPRTLIPSTSLCDGKTIYKPKTNIFWVL